MSSHVTRCLAGSHRVEISIGREEIPVRLGFSEIIINNHTRQILEKGHNTLVHENHPYNHGETSAIRDAGLIDFSQTTIFTTLSPCDVCATLIYMRRFNRVVIGDVTNASGNSRCCEKEA